MNYLSKFRAVNPDLQGFSDDQIVEALPQLLPERFGGKPMSQVRAEALLAPEELEARQFEQQTDGRGVLGYARDLGISALKGAISVPEMAVGLADIPTGGRVGQFLENEGGLLGFRPGEAKEILSDLHTDQYKAQQQRFSDADGVMDKAAVAVQNPSLIFNQLVGSGPSIIAGGAIGRGLTAATRLGQMGLKGQVAAGAIGEGATMAGLQAEGMRQQTDDGLLTAEQSAIALGTGTLGTLFAIGGGRLAQKLGVGDIDTLVARGLKPSDVAGEIAQMPAKSIPRKVIEGAVTEGLLEELPQSVSEQILQNLALDKEWSEGVDDAVVMGTLAGMVMGGGVGAFSGNAAAQRNPVADANTRINAAGDQVAAAGGDALAQESAKAQAASSEIPGAVGEAKTVADTLKAAGQVSAAELGIQMPEQRDWSQYDSAPIGREAAQPVPRQEEQAYPRQSARDMSGLDGLIITADRTGFADEAAMLRTSQRLYKQAEDARTSNDADRYFSLIDRADRLYREATETNDQVREIADQFPVPYVAQGEVTGGEVALSEAPKITMPEQDLQGESVTVSTRSNQPLLTQQAERLEAGSPNTPYIMGRDRPERTFEPVQNEYEGVGRNTVERTAQAKTNALPTGSATRAITPDQYRNVMERARLALRTPVSRRTPEMTQALEVRNQVRAGQVEVTETKPLQAAPAPDLRMKANGAPFASERAAQASAAFRDNRDYASIVPVDGGFAVQVDTQARDQAEAQATEATQAKSEQAKRRMFREPDTVNDDMLDAIALMGGIDRAEAEAEGIDPANFGRQAGGIRYVFPRQNGDSFDGMAERLAQYGYLDPRVDRLDDLRDKLDQAINGNAKIMTPEGYEALAEKEAAAEAQLQQEHEPLADDITSDEAWAGEAYANALEQGVPAPVIDAILEQYSDDPVIALVELNDAINQSREASGTQAGESQESGSDNLEATLTAERPFTPEQAAEIWGSVDPDPEPLLSSYTESDLQAQADARAAAEQAEADAQREAEQKAQADAEVNDFSLTGSSRPADVAAAAGQNDMFGVGGSTKSKHASPTASLIHKDNAGRILDTLISEYEKARKRYLNRYAKNQYTKTPDPDLIKQATTKVHNLPNEGWSEVDVVLGSALMPVITNPRAANYQELITDAFYTTSGIERPQSTERQPVSTEQAEPEAAGQPALQQASTGMPWEMTRAEWEAAREQARPNNAQSNYTRASGSEAAARISTVESLLYGVNDDAQAQLKSAAAGEIELTPDQVESLMERINTPVQHRDVIAKALREGQPVPDSVLKEYPDLQQGQQEASRPASEQAGSNAVTANGVTVEVPAIDQQLVDDYNRATHMGRGRDLNAELRSEAEGLLNDLAERKYMLDTPEQKAEAKRLIESYLQAQAEFSQWDARYSANNPSWIVTGRSGRNMDKANRANERHMDEYTKRVDRLQAQRDRIGDTLYKMRPQEVQENQALSADLRNITQQAGHILGYLEEGKNALVAETRKWASPKAHKLIERSLDADRGRTIEHIRELENTKAVQDAGGLVKVFGSRSKAGKLVKELLDEQAPQFSRSVPQTDTASFRNWFGNSKVVDANGDPLVVYHGTSADFSVFDESRIGSVTDDGWYGKGFYFTPNRHWTFAEDAADQTGGAANVMPVYLSIQNPVYADAYAEQGSDMVRMAKERGRDGVIVRYPYDHEMAGEIAEIIVWDNTQIKSATGNNGNFDPSNPDIRFSPRNEVTSENTATEGNTNEGIDQLNEALQKAGETATARRAVLDALTGGKRQAAEFAEALASAFGQTITWVQTDTALFDGVTVNGQLFVDVDSSVPYHIVMGHELTHILRNEHPDLYAQLESMILPDATARSESAEFHRFEEGSVKANEEYVADVVGNRFGERKFWADMAATEPSLFRRVAAIVRSLIQRVTDQFKSDRTLYGDAVKDLNRVRNQVAGVMMEYRRRQKAMSAQEFRQSQTGDLRFSLRDRMRRGGESEADLSVVAKAQRTLGNNDRNAWDKVKRTFKRNFTAAGLLPDSVFREKVLRDSEVNAHEFDTAHYIGALDRAINKAYGTGYNKLSDAQREALDAQMKSTEPDMSIPEPVRVALMDMRRSIAGLSQQYAEILQQQVEELQAQGNDADAMEKAMLLETIINNMDTYAHRSYRAFDDPDWPAKVSKDPEIFPQAIEYLKGRYLEQGMTDAQAEQAAIRTARTILEEGTAYEDMSSFIKESKLGSKDLSTLKRRKDIAPEIRALLGEYKDVKINYAKTLAKMSRLVANTKLLDRIKEIGLAEGWLFTEDNKPLDQSVTKVAGDASEVYAPLNGYYVPNEINQALIDTLGKEQMADWLRAVIRMNGAVKYGKTVLSPTTAFRNWMSAAFFAMANGHFDLTQMRKSISGFSEYFGHGENPEKVAYLRKLKELGVVYDTAYAGEMMDLLADAKGGWAEKLFEKPGLSSLKAANGLAQKFYQYGDDFWKIMGFENEKAMLMKYKGMSEAEAEVEAAERIRNTYPTYSMTGRAVNWLRRFPLAGTFVSFPAEVIRTQFHMLRYLKQDWKDSPAYAARKVVGLAMVSGLAYAAQALSKDLFDIGDDEEEAVRLLAASWNSNSNIWFMGRDEKGSIRYLDFSFLDPYNYFKRPINAVMRDQPLDKAAIQAASEMLSPFFGTDIAFGAISEIWNNKKEGGGRIYNPQDMALDQAQSIANHLRKAIQPGFVGNMERAWMAANDQVTASGKQYKAEEELAAFFGFRASTFDPKTALYYNSFEFKDRKRDATAVLMNVAKDPNRVSDSDLMKAYDTASRSRLRAYTDMIRLVEAARAAGMNNMQLNTSLRRSGISKEDIRALMQGRIPAWRPDQRMMRNTIRKAELLYGPEVVREMREREQAIIRRGYRE